MVTVKGNKKIINIIEYCKKTDNPHIIKCGLKTDNGIEEIFIGNADDLLSIAMEMTDADAYQYSGSGTYVLGFRDEEGKLWYGGADPSAFINNIEYLEREVHPKVGEPFVEVVDNPLIDELGKKEDLYYWRPNRPARHIAEILTKKRLGLI